MFTYSPPFNIHVRLAELSYAPLRLFITFTCLLYVLPYVYSFALGAKFFYNIENKKVFTLDNARILEKIGSLLIFVSLVFPFLSTLLFTGVFNTLSENQVHIGTAADFGTMMISLAVLAIAFAFRYGVYLQDEVDQTL